jgi:hypothetical protein
METTQSIAVYSQSFASMHDASWPEESDQFILNCRRQAVPFCLWPKLAVKVAVTPDHAGPLELRMVFPMSS